MPNPTLAGVAGSQTFLENTVNATPQLLDSDVTFNDVDNNFNGGTVTVSGLLAEDRVAVRHQGTGAGQIGVAGSNVTFGGTTIGTFTGGSGTALTITLNASATSAAVDALIQNLTYGNVSDTPTASRTLTVNVVDAAGGDVQSAGSWGAVVGGGNPFNFAGDPVTGSSPNGFDAGTNSTPAFLDLDKDGDLDMIAGTGDVPGAGNGGPLVAYLNNGNGTYTPNATFFNGGIAPGGGLATFTNPVAVDWDVDGDMDLIVGDRYGLLTYYRHDAGSTFTEVSSTFADITASPIGYGGYQRVAFVLDYDGDGDLDVMLGVYDPAVPQPVATYRNDGGGQFTAMTGGANPFGGILANQYSAFTTIDYDADGDKDVVYESAGTLHYVRNNGAGTFTELSGAGNNPFHGLAVPQGGGIAFFDYDGDRDQDLLMGRGDGSFSYFTNSATHGASITVNVTAEADNTAPVIDLNGAAAGADNTVSYTENGAPVALAPAGTVIDLDSSNFDGGRLYVDLGATGQIGDRLIVTNQGTGAGQIGVSGGAISYQGVQIGTYGGDGFTFSPWIIALNSNATPAAVEALTRAIAFATVSDAVPASSQRTARIFVEDGDGGQSGQVFATINLTGVNDAPGATIASSTVVASGSEFRVNTVTGDEQSQPSVAVLSSGASVVVWQSNLQDGSSYGVYMQRYDAAGVAQGAETRVNTTTTSVQLQPSVAALSDGGYIVTWSSVDANNTGVFMQRYNAAGVAQGAETQVNTYTTDVQSESSATGLAGGGYVVTWKSFGQDGSSDGIYMRRFDASGAALSGEVRVNTFTANAQYEPSVATLAGGGFVVTWSSQLQDGSNYGIYAQRYDSAGVAQGSETRVNTTTANEQYGPSIAALPGGGYVIAWASSGQDGSGYGLYMQRYNASGVAQGVETRVNTTTAGSQLQASVAAIAGGGFVVTWSSDQQDGSGFGIYAQRYDASGVAQGGETRINSTTTDAQLASSVAGLPGDGYLVAWQSNAQDGSGYGVYAQRFAGALAATEQVALDLKGSLAVTDADAGAGSLTATLSVTSGVINASVGDSGTTVVSGNGTGSVVISGTLAALNALFAAGGTSTLTYMANSDAPPASATLTLGIDDNGSTGSGGALAASASRTIVISAVNDAPVAQNDAVTTTEVTALVGGAGALFGDNGSGADADADGPALAIAAVNGVGASVGTQITLASGAKLTVNADGSYSYDPNGAFAHLVSAATAGILGAFNTSATDSFTYTLAGGGTATVTVTVHGADGAGDELWGNALGNTINGSATADYFDLSQGGDDAVFGDASDDAFYFGGAFTAADTVDGGAGSNDQIGLEGDYSGGLTLGAGTIAGIEVIAVLPGFDYSLTTVDANVPNGGTLKIFAGQLGVGDNFTFNGSAETNGNFMVYAGAGTDIVTTGAGVDGIYFGPGKFDAAVDRVDGGAGTNDQLALDGHYAITLDGTAIKNIEVIALLPGVSGDLATYDLTLSDSLIAAGQTMIFWATQVQTAVTINGSAENEGAIRILAGQAGDTLTGGDGDDWFWGGLGADMMTGGAGADTFAYTEVMESGLLAQDVIYDFGPGDRIDLAQVDADAATAGDQAFHLGATPGHTGDVVLSYDAGNGFTSVSLHVDGDGTADAVIYLLGNHLGLGAADFVF